MATTKKASAKTTTTAKPSSTATKVGVDRKNAPKASPSRPSETGKGANATTPAGTTRALDHLADAAGLSFVKDGFAFSKEQDVLFALGWPHMRWIVHGHPDDAAPTDDKLLKICEDGGTYGLSWPRGMANRLIRGFAASSVRATSADPKFALPALADARDVDASEGPSLIRGLFGEKRYNDGLVEHFTFLLEAMHGPDAVLEWILGAFETMTAPPPRVEEACALATAAGILRLRVPPASARAAKTRLEKLATRIESESLGEFLRSAVGGAKAAKAQGLHPSYYLNVTDDPTAVVAAAKEGEHITSPRMIFLGGAAVVKAIAPHWKAIELDHEQAALARGLAEVRMPEAMELLATLAVSSKAKKVATALLETRADYARPFLEKASKGKGGTRSRRRWRWSDRLRPVGRTREGW